MIVVFISIGILVILCIGAGWLVQRYKNEKRSAASFKIVEAKKSKRESEDSNL